MAVYFPICILVFDGNIKEFRVSVSYYYFGVAEIIAFLTLYPQPMIGSGFMEQFISFWKYKLSFLVPPRGPHGLALTYY